MMWTGNEVEEVILNRPRLSIALLQITAQRCLHLGWRLESFESDTIERRLARALIRFSERFGKVLEDGSIEMMPLTHAMLSRYVGTSHEIITHHYDRVSAPRLSPVLAEGSRHLPGRHHAGIADASLIRA
jgi:CRP/FNR family transcriptional regulator, cyclic AMP receptor protein